MPINSDNTPKNRLAFGCRGVNTVVDELPAFNAAHFICAEPRWMVTIAPPLCLLSACVLAYWAGSANRIAAAVILGIGIACAMLAAALRPTRSAIYYASDARGVYFPSRRNIWKLGRVAPRSWLFVPWSRVSRISVQPLLDESGRRGVTFCLRASDEQRRRYFSRSATLDAGRDPGIGTDCSILVVFPGAFKSPYRIASILCAFQQQLEDDNARSCAMTAEG